MNDQLLDPLIESWLKDTDCPPSDIGRSTAQIESRLPQTRQWGRWWPLPSFERLTPPMAGRKPAGGSSMFSAVKFVAAAVIVALFGGFLLTGILTTQQADELVPAAVTESPSPMTTEELAFPTGIFVAEEDGLTLEFRADGTCQRSGVPCTYGVNGALLSEMTFEDPSGAQVPATYYWDFDGEHLTFESWGEDRQPSRKDAYADHTYRPVGETLPMPATVTDFPTGEFVSTGGSGTANLGFREDGSFYGSSGANGKYAVNGDLFTEMTFTATNVALVPATYHWHWDGERLRFSLWGEDNNRWRTALLLGRTFVRDEADTVLGDKRRLHLSDPRLDFWVTVEIQERDDGRFVATADIEGDPLGQGIGDTLREAVKAALEALGEPYASETAESVTN